MEKYHPDLEEIFRCDDQSALINNFVANVNPTPGAWSHHAGAQSALGQVSFPEVLTLTRGEVYLCESRGVIVEQMLDRQTWLPWAYDGANSRISVQRSIHKDIWHARIVTPTAVPALLLIECVPGNGLEVSLTRTPTAFSFKWEEKFQIELRFSGDISRIDTGDDPAPLRRRFAGFDDVPLNPSHLNWVWPYLHRCWIAVEFTGELEVLFAVTRAGEETAEIDGQRLRQAERQRWEDFFNTQVPALNSADPCLRDSYYFAWQMLWANRCTGGAGQLPHPFTSPARLHYGSQWWWDEAFNALMYRHLHDPDIPYEFLVNFQLAQTADGMIPGYLGFTRREGEASPIDMQPPVIGFVLQLLRERPGWPQPLRPLYDMLHRHAQWHDLPQRDSDGDGLVEYHDQNDSATDQSSRWDAQKVDPTLVMGALRPTEAVDGNVWMSILWEVLGDMAEELADPESAAAHRKRAVRMMELVEEHMWDEEDGLYYDIDAISHQLIKVKTPFCFMPMLSRHVHSERVARMVEEHLTNPQEFYSTFPLCSVAMNEPTFDAIDMFRGASWVNINWMVIEGLARHGYHELAVNLARKTVEMVGPRYINNTRTRSPRLWEWYHPHTGEALGNCQYTWSALVIDLIIRFLQ